MQAVELKLKQASAVLGVEPKDLQNLVQFKVLRPTRRDGLYWFDNQLLLEAKGPLRNNISNTECFGVFWWGDRPNRNQEAFLCSGQAAG